VTAELYRQGMAPQIVFSGATSRTTRERMPRGEAEHYRERAIELSVPSGAILVEAQARNTGENIRFSRALLEEQRVPVSSVLLMSPRPELPDWAEGVTFRMGTLCAESFALMERTMGVAIDPTWMDAALRTVLLASPDMFFSDSEAAWLP
jgi:hypothetical protein